jgi:multimeric flavodoxin WrbA
MSAIMILGSRNPNGQTAQAADAFIEGIATASLTCDRVFLPEQALERCRQCEDNGWGICRTEGRCIIEDDFAELFESMAESALVVFATPVYFGDLSESLRAFLDRVRRITRVEQQKARLTEKPCVGICVAGGGGGGAPRCARCLEHILGPAGVALWDVVPVRRQNLQVKKQVLRTTGQWIARQILAPSTAQPG